MSIMTTQQQTTTPEKDNIIAGSGSARYSMIVDKIIECANNHLITLMNQMLTTADAKLATDAKTAKTEAEHRNIIVCSGLFRKSGNDIRQLFFMKLNNSLAASRNLSAENQDDTALVGQDEMDEMVAITTMYSKAMNIYGTDAKHFEARIEYLEIMCDDVFDKEALDPKHICEVFQSTIESIDTSIDVKLIFYKFFDQEVCAKLGGMYRTLNKLLIANNIMPEVVLTTTKSIEIENIEEKVSQRVATYYDPEENIQTDFIPRTKAEISRIVNEFMTGEMTITSDEIELPESFLRTPTQQDIDGKNCYQRKDVLQALSNLQRKLSSLHNRSESLTSSQIKQELLDDIEKTHKAGQITDVEKKVSLLDERSMDFVGLMFDAIVKDETISEIMTSLIGRLQIPVMKLAMTDRKIFDQQDHPARVTIDLLTTAGKGINSREDQLYHALSDVIDTILNKFDIDISAFESAINEIKAIIQKEKQVAEEQEKQQQKQILFNHARNIIVTQMKLLFCDRKIPDSVRPLVLKNWASLMFNRYLRYGRGSTPWLQSVMLLKLLIKCIQPIRSASKYDLVNNNHIALSEAINDELRETQQDHDEITEQINALKQHLSQLINHYKPTQAKAAESGSIKLELVDLEFDDSDEEAQQIQQQIDTARQKIAQLSSDTRPGVWYEIYSEKDKAMRRLKLSVILNDTAKLIFVDRLGRKVIEKDADVFARELAESRSRIIADHSTFDHALGMVIGRMAA